MKDTNRKLKRLNELFGNYKAEWLRGDIFNFFAVPPYFTALKDHRPCILQGGRGTGKTTVLRGLSYQGQYALLNKNIGELDKLDFIGLYFRANTNHVRAFQGGGLEERIWGNIFAHYMSLIICNEILSFVKWYAIEKGLDGVYMPPRACSRIAKSVHINQECNSFTDLYGAFEDAMYEFQSCINNVSPNNLPNLSLNGDPIRIVSEEVLKLPEFTGKMFYFLVDEYENFTDYQQVILNTFIKHNTDFYTFKIGVRELGWRVKHTLNNLEKLNDPADYFLIDINEEVGELDFKEFAMNVCQTRLEQLVDDEANDKNYSITESLAPLSMEAEAVMLGVKESELITKFVNLPIKYKEIVQDLPELYLFLIAFWAKKENQDLEKSILEYSNNRVVWDRRYNNYKYDLLFKIRKGKVGIQKFYSGWETYIKIADKNIRYLMELVYKALEKHIEEKNDILNPVSAHNQTIAAQDVGFKNLKELEGLWENGAQLTKLLLGFGRIFNVIARNGIKIAPEINQLSITGKISKECSDILIAAVMNLALIRMAENKMSSLTATKDYIYSIHPIYAPYFVFSYRRKRKMMISGDDFMGVISEQDKYIKKILNSKNVEYGDDTELPNQLTLFEEYFND